MIEIRFHGVFLAADRGYVRLVAEICGQGRWPYDDGAFMTTLRDMLRAGF